MIRISQMDEAHAREIALWRYPGIYEQYSFQFTKETIGHLLNGSYFFVEDDEDGLIGLFCFGPSARIPVLDEAATYTPDALDIGLGLRPDLCGKGIGTSFLQIAMEVGQKLLSPPRYRLSVAAFNLRAISVYRRCGFVTQKVEQNIISGQSYYIMVCEQ
ncbi:MAG: GNAT family N-acetyltransferase [Clostridiales bacterium]|nr:GNAT family N-acetyltransferase [Clostridiales bacterium]